MGTIDPFQVHLSSGMACQALLTIYSLNAGSNTDLRILSDRRKDQRSHVMLKLALVFKNF
jgi:hypothetical protein